MKRVLLFACIFGVIFLSTIFVSGQTEDIRQATGLPIPIGAPVIYGQVKIRGLAAGDQKPTIFVSLLIGGSIADRMQPNERGYYYFLKSPADGATIIFEANNSEVGRVVLSGGVGSSVRRDIELDWSAVDRSAKAPGVISVQDAYKRSPDAEKAFDKAMSAVHEKHSDEAAKLFLQIVEKDPKDFVAWTELGTVYFGKSKYADAENAYAKAIENKPDFIVALMNLGKLYLAQKQAEKAIVPLTRAATADRSSADAFHYLGEAYLQAKQGSKAVIALNEAIRLAPVEKAEVHLRLAALYHAAGLKDRAANEYKLFLEKVPNYKEKEQLEKYIKENAK